MKSSTPSLRRSLMSLALMAAFAAPGAYAATITVDPSAADPDSSSPMAMSPLNVEFKRPEA